MKDRMRDKLERLEEKKRLADKANAAATARAEAPKPKPKPEPPAAPATEAGGQGDEPAKKREPSKPSGVVLSMHLPKRTVALLQRLAGARRIKEGKGKASVSALVADLVEAQRAELEAEVERLEAEIGGEE